MQVHIARDPDSQEVLSEDEQEPYGMKTGSAAVDQLIALLRRAAEKPWAVPAAPPRSKEESLFLPLCRFRLRGRSFVGGRRGDAPLWAEE
ncbi:hypothetical protein Snoj_71820 [Streptomyces nojiriensis]|uniref:Uncharacterized protein n=1 Tax=Streptomyces nojiriensis TaxID=66374 RepID=A0ABQ3SYQ1_9ACTN|nr:hypothetical protein [Streptomyces nojiriensis]QTI46779.1 hypothetical protein JYK04_04617 [Streptomyces nojiriensis]GGS01299.1 hypothetical protein GCM10010205_32690 [Streptomyces nojiriensis]GHI73264.1 hypothetical protein Snoj_71820 [Streptomyces nojiriensis]